MHRWWTIEIRHLGRGTDMYIDGVVSNVYTLSEAISVVERWSPKFQKKARIVPA